MKSILLWLKKMFKLLAWASGLIPLRLLLETWGVINVLIIICSVILSILFHYWGDYLF